jgi:hypothetical protein
VSAAAVDLNVVNDMFFFVLHFTPPAFSSFNLDWNSIFPSLTTFCNADVLDHQTTNLACSLFLKWLLPDLNLLAQLERAV